MNVCLRFFKFRFHSHTVTVVYAVMVDVGCHRLSRIDKTLKSKQIKQTLCLMLYKTYARNMLTHMKMMQ